MRHILKGSRNDVVEDWVRSSLKYNEQIVVEKKCDGPFYTSASFLQVIITGLAFVAIGIYTSSICDIPRIVYWSRAWPTLLIGFVGLAVIYFVAESVKQSLFVTNDRIFIAKRYSWLGFSIGEVIELSEIKHIRTTLLRNGLRITKRGLLGKQYAAFRLPNALAFEEEVQTVLKLLPKR